MDASLERTRQPLVAGPKIYAQLAPQGRLPMKIASGSLRDMTAVSSPVSTAGTEHQVTNVDIESAELRLIGDEVRRPSPTTRAP